MEVRSKPMPLTISGDFVYAQSVKLDVFDPRHNVEDIVVLTQLPW